MNYGLLSFGGSSTEHGLNKLFKLQKKAVRIVNNAGYLDPTTPLFANFNILKLNDLYYHRLGIFMYKYTHNMLPQTFNHLFSLTSSVHSYETRSSSRGDLYVSKNRTCFLRNSPFQRSIIYWNELDTGLKQCTTVASFARKLKESIINFYS